MMKRVSVSLVLAALIVVPGARAVSAIQQRPSAAETYVVRPGDTLWDIAARTSGGGDVRRRVYRIRELNRLSGPLMPGQKILVPAG